MDLIEIFDYDSQTGKISNPLALTTEQLDEVYGVEFSPDSRLLYVGLRKENASLYQLDLRFKDDLSLLESMVKLGEYRHEYGAIQIAPNGKIYVALKDSNVVGVINNPNQQGFGCNYMADGIKLQGNSRSMLGLPTFVHPYFNLCLDGPDVVCEYDDINLSSNEISGYDADIYWESPNGRKVFGRDALFKRVSRYESGYFKISVTVLGVEFIDSINVEIFASSRNGDSP